MCANIFLSHQALSPQKETEDPCESKYRHRHTSCVYVSKSVTTNSGCPLQTTPPPPSGCSLSGKSIQRASKVTHTIRGRTRALTLSMRRQPMHTVVADGTKWLHCEMLCRRNTTYCLPKKHPHKSAFCPRVCSSSMALFSARAEIR